MSQLFSRVVGSSGRSYIFKFEVPFLAPPQNKSWNDIQRHKTSKLNLQQFSTKAFARKSCHKSENDTSHLVFNVM